MTADREDCGHESTTYQSSSAHHFRTKVVRRCDDCGKRLVKHL